MGKLIIKILKMVKKCKICQIKGPREAWPMRIRAKNFNIYQSKICEYHTVDHCNKFALGIS